MRCVPIVASLAAHMAVLAWLMLQRPYLAPSAETLDQPIEVLFEAADAAPAPPSAPVATPAEPTADLPVATAPAPVPEPPAPAPTPEPLEPLAPVMLAPALPAVPVRPAAPPKPNPPRPSRPAVATAAPAPQSTPASRDMPPVAAAAPPSASAAATDPGWRAALGSWLAAHKRYPEQARRRGDEGTVGVRFTVDAAGRVLEVAVTRSSGSTLLDDAAREMLAGQRVPPFPPSMTLAQTTVPVNIRFQLEQ